MSEFADAFMDGHYDGFGWCKIAFRVQSYGIADGARRRSLVFPLIVEALAALEDGGTEDFHIMRVLPSTRTFSQMLSCKHYTPKRSTLYESAINRKW